MGSNVDDPSGSDTERFDVVVVGGGAVGSSAARTLAEQGVDVALCERKSIGNGSTAKSAGIFRRAFEHEVTARLAAESVAVFESLEADGAGIGLEQPGYAILGGDKHRSSLERAADNAERFGAPVERYDASACRERVPGLIDESVTRGIEVRTDGYADPYLVATEQARRAADAGATVRTDCAVTDLRCRNGEVTAVVADGNVLKTDAVIIAAGAWTPRVLDLAGLSVPVDPVRTFAMTSPTSLPADHPMVLSLPQNAYYREEPVDETLVGGALSTTPADPDDYDGDVDLDRLLELGQRTARIDDRFSDMEIGGAWAGLKSVSPDKLPVVGRHPDCPNLVCATGFNGHGFMLSPAVGEVLADLSLGAEPTIAVDPLSPARFDGGTENQPDTTIDLQ